jgi:hypothetical protein
MGTCPAPNIGTRGNGSSPSFQQLDRSRRCVACMSDRLDFPRRTFDEGRGETMVSCLFVALIQLYRTGFPEKGTPIDQSIPLI